MLVNNSQTSNSLDVLRLIPQDIEIASKQLIPGDVTNIGLHQEISLSNRMKVVKYSGPIPIEVPKVKAALRFTFA